VALEFGPTGIEGPGTAAGPTLVAASVIAAGLYTRSGPVPQNAAKTFHSRDEILRGGRVSVIFEDISRPGNTALSMRTIRDLADSETF
jgi:hypothetical protein